MEPIEYIVTTFYSTHVMNVANWRAAYCLFPHTTFVEGKMGLLSVKSLQELRSFEKYVERGFGRLSVPEVSPYIDELGVTRRVGDAFSRKLKFSDMRIDGKDPEEQKRPLEQFEFKFDGKCMVKTAFDC